VAAAYPALVQALLQPQAYPGGVTSVELVETHVSYIFLTGEHAYKVKKPVNYGFLDFTTLEKRRYFCGQEVALNRRMAPEVYLGVSEVREQAGNIGMDGLGRTVEYAVRMRQLPRHRAMNVLLPLGRVSKAHVRRLAAKIARFHANAAATSEIARLGGLERVRQNVQENLAQMQPYVGWCLSQQVFDTLSAYSNSFLMAKAGLFQSRASQGRVRDCHGDLHTAQIFLLSEPQAEGGWDGISIIDCIEFNERFRYCDVAEDIAFLAMDLDYYQRPDLSQCFVQAYVAESGDPGVLDLLDFFKVYRACVRGKVTAFRLNLPAQPVAPGVWADRVDNEQRQLMAASRVYFQLAASYVPGESGPGSPAVQEGKA